MVLSPPRGSAGPELPALRAAPASAGRAGSWGRGIQILIQLSPAEHGHRRVASGAVSEPVPGCRATGQQPVPNRICQASGRISQRISILQKGYLFQSSRYPARIF